MPEQREGAPRPWDALSADEKDFFENPHYFMHTTSTYLKRARAVLAGLDEAGKRQATQALTTATGKLQEYNRAYPAEALTLLRELGGSRGAK